MGGNFDEAVAVFVVAEIPFVFMVEVVGGGIDEGALGDVGFAFDNEDVEGVGEGKGDHLVVDEVVIFLAAGDGGDVEMAIEPDKPHGH